MKVGLAQIAPVWLDRTATIKKVVQWTEQAANHGCQLVAFGESLVPGYPFWLSFTGGAEFESPTQKEIHAAYLQQAVCLADDHLQPVQQIAADRKIQVWLGCFERAADRGSHTGYASLVRISDQGQISNVHRKLVPTYEERLAWGSGDGHGLQVFRHEEFAIGGLNCWENWMPLARASLYAQGENVHIAVWPGSRRNTADISRFIARESRSYVLSISGVLTRNDIPDQMPCRKQILANCPPVVADGGSCIAGPDGKWIVAPVDSAEQIVLAELDYQLVLRERQNFDSSGHYSRPDVTRLIVNRQRQSIVEFED